MKFEPKTKEQLSNLLAAGEGKFIVLDAREEISQKTSLPMFVVSIKLYDMNQKSAVIKYYVATEKQLRNFCYSGGLMAAYESGEVTEADCVKAKGNCLIGIKKGDPAPDGGIYPDRNVISYFIEQDVLDVTVEKLQKIEVKKDAPFYDDGIPF